MEDEEGKMDRATNERRKPGPPAGKELRKSAGRRGMQWSFIVAGAFVLCLVAGCAGLHFGLERFCDDKFVRTIPYDVSTW